MSYEWYGNEDAGDLEMMGAADYSGHLGELEADNRSRDWASYVETWANWHKNGHEESPTPDGVCEECLGPMDASNCHAGAYSWHCGCYESGGDFNYEPQEDFGADM